MKNWFYHNYLIRRANTNCETALSGVSALPASGSYIDVSGYETIHCLIHLGTIHASDSPSFTLKCADSAGGTLDTISGTDLTVTPATSDDGQFILLECETSQLPEDHHYVACALSGTLTNGSYADVIFLLGGGRHLPVSQSASLIESGHAKLLAG